MTVILVVEDEIFVLEVARMVLEDMGFELLTATDIDQALAHLRSPRQIDVLFTDIRLKKSVYGGYEVAREAIAIRPELHILYAANDPISPDLAGMAVAGAHFLPKPYGQLELHNAVEKLLGTAF